jgi:putative heme-binding domain-containing protein
MQSCGKKWRGGYCCQLIVVAGVLVGGLLLAVTSGASDPPPADRSTVAIEALKRLKGVDLEANPSLKAAVNKVLNTTRGTPQFVELVRELNLKGQGPALLEMAVLHPDQAAGVEACRLLLEQQELDLLKQALGGQNAAPLAEALGNTGQREAVPLLKPLVLDKRENSAVQQNSVRALAQTAEGANWILDLVARSEWPERLKLTAAKELHNARWPAVKTRADELFPLEPVEGTLPLPPVSKLIKLPGDPTRGAEVFTRESVGCNKCHRVNGQGGEVGPDLSEVGTKLAKEAIYESILDPSAGIAFGYEAWQLQLKNGDDAYGLLADETADEIAIKSQTGIVTRYKKADVATKTKSATSLMPTGLAQTMSRQDLVDLVEYLSSLKKKQ